jgi:hypothetical protein
MKRICLALLCGLLGVLLLGRAIPSQVPEQPFSGILRIPGTPSKGFIIENKPERWRTAGGE